jgi:imidazolonepropionase-like amidohydrolase
MPPLVVRAALAWLGPGRVDENVQVECENGRITRVGRHGPIHAGATALEIEGFLMPAGADRHVHIGLSDPVAVLRRGITAVRDLAWPADRIFPLAEASELPSYQGPLIRAVGPMLTGPGGYPTTDRWAPEGTGWELGGGDGPSEAARAVQEVVDRGAVAIKVSLNAEDPPTVSDAELAAICEAARRAGVPVSCHAQGAGQVERALGAGVDELAHTPWTHRLSTETIEAAARSMRIVSTLDIHSYGKVTPELVIALDNLQRFHAAGGTVIYGTDLGNGPIPAGIHTRELRLLAEAGLQHDEVFAALVRTQIELGAPADLMALATDPRRDLGAFERVVFVAREGRVVFPA